MTFGDVVCLWHAAPGQEREQMRAIGRSMRGLFLSCLSSVRDPLNTSAR